MKCIAFKQLLNLLPPFLFYLPSKKLLKHCVAEVVHELADPIVACVLCAWEASTALAVDEAHDDALRQGERVIIGAEMQLVLRGAGLTRFRRLDCQSTVVTTFNFTYSMPVQYENTARGFPVGGYSESSSSRMMLADDAIAGTTTCRKGTVAYSHVSVALHCFLD